ncbi:hypothetical protein VPH35_110900 [Triticum aestivum]
MLLVVVRGVRADQIDLKTLDEQLDRHLARARTGRPTPLGSSSEASSRAAPSTPSTAASSTASTSQVSSS